MNRSLLITIGIVIILLVLGLWVYLMLFGTPKDTKEIFANLGFERTAQPTTITPPDTTDTPIENLVDTKNGKLRQLTTRPVAGFITASTTEGEVVRYAERGTGHIYEINLASGAENMVSRTTIPQVSTAVFSEQGEKVALTSFSNYLSNVFVGTIANDATAGITLEPGASNLSFDGESAVLYSVARNGTTIGYRHNLDTKTRAEVFTFNFSNLDVAWGRGLTQVYLATKPAENLEGFIYTIKNNVVTPAVPSAYGLSALYSNESLITTYRDGESFTSSAVAADGSSTDLPLIALKEKCVFDQFNANFLWCGAPANELSKSFVEDWYKGATKSDDYLWLVDIKKQTAALTASPEKILGRSLDITNQSQTPTGSGLLFKNKTDQTLWLYDLLNS